MCYPVAAVIAIFDAIPCHVMASIRTRRSLERETKCARRETRVPRTLDDVPFFFFLSVPAPEHKKPTDYVSGLFRVEATLQPRIRRRLSLEESTASCSEDADVDDKK